MPPFADALKARPNRATPPHTCSDHAAREEIRRLAKALSRVKRRIHHPKLPNDACYAGVAYALPDPPLAGATLLYEHLGPLPPGMSLDRIDPHGNYALFNLRYATPKEQTANRRPPRKRKADEDEDSYDE